MTDEKDDQGSKPEADGKVTRGNEFDNDDLAIDVQVLAESVLPKERTEGGDDKERVDEDERSSRDEARRSREARADSSDDGDERLLKSKAMQRRIQRERTLRNRAELRAEAAERRLEAQETRLAKIEREMRNGGGSAADATIKGIEAELQALKTQLTAAIEAGGSAEQAELNMKIADKSAALNVAKAEKRIREESAAAGGEEVVQPRAAPGRTEEWKRANRKWFSSPEFRDVKEDALDIDRQILKEIKRGKLDFEEYGDEHFEELNRRLAKEHPDVDLKTADGDEFFSDEDGDMDDDDQVDTGVRLRSKQRTPERTNRRAPMGGNGSRDGRRSQTEVDLARLGKVRLKPEDKTQMRIYGLDPNNDKDVKAFARERMRTIVSEANRARS